MLHRPFSRSLPRALCLSVLLGLFAFAAVAPAHAGNAATYTKLHDFGKNGAAPQYANLIFDVKGSAYGMTYQGGATGNGIVFKIKPDGTFYDLHDFMGGATDGANPQGSLTLSGDGSTLYGMTFAGGASGKGIVFRLPVTGGTLTDLHDFTGSITAPLDGATPYGSLILSGSTLYGMTFAGGAAFGFSNKGIVFSIDTNGNGFTDLHDFTGSTTDGATPYGSLTLSADGLTLYGMTFAGGANSIGIVFRLPVTGGTLTDLHDFASGSNADGYSPYGSLTLSADGLTLYGMTYAGSVASIGIVFSLPAAGGTLTTLHIFRGSVDGANPTGSLILSGSTLYGMTRFGGASRKGVVFSINTARPYTLTDLHNFTGSTTDGSQPYGSLILSGSTLYGMTSAGGASNTGIMFSLPVTAHAATTPNELTNLHQFGVTTATTEGASPQSALVSDGTTGSLPGFYLTTLKGGASNDGTLYDLVTTSTIAANFTKKVDFLASTTGRLPSGLAYDGASTYYGLTEGGSPGQFFSYAQTATSVTPYSLNVLGTHPLAPPAYIDATHVLFSTLEGGPSSQGALLNFNPASPTVSLAGTFTGAANGAYPTGLVQFNATTFYGSTRAGGVNGTGAIYQVTLNAGVYSVPLLVASFNALGSNATGANPQGTLVSDGTSLYGVAVSGGAHGTGTVWKFTPPSSLTALYAFTALAGNTEGASPVAGLTLNGTTLYGVASAGGQYGFGALFKLSMAGSFIRMYSFSGVFGDSTTPFDGQTPAAPLTYTTISGTPTLLGTTSYGGQYGQGTAFSLTGF